jgi:hypothetical protein
MLLQYFDMGKQTFIFTDAHKTGLGAMLAQGDSVENAGPVAIASRATNDSEQRYPQIDLEALGIDFALRRFRNYVVGSPTKIQVITDHQPLHSKPLQKLPQSEQAEADDLNNLLYMLHTTPVLDCIDYARIAQCTKDQTLARIRELINQGLTWIPKTETIEVQRFKSILPQLTVTGNGIILKDERIVLPEKLQEMAIQIAHRGAHPGQSGLERRLRYHFFFHDMNKKVKEFVESCDGRTMFIDKKTKEPTKPHQVPEKCWDTVAVDLFGPMPSSKHVVVVQDLASRFPAAKLVTSMKADRVIPQHSVKFMEPMKIQRSKYRIMAHHLIALECRSLQQVGQLNCGTMKIGHQEGVADNKTLKRTMNNYRQTPHPATGIPPAAMLFRDGQRLEFPRRCATEEEVRKAKETDRNRKAHYENDVNISKYRKKTDFNMGEKVLIRNYRWSAKFDPVFLNQPLKIIDINKVGNKIIVEQEETGLTLCRHPDDIKPFKLRKRSYEDEQEDTDGTEELQWPEADEDGQCCFEGKQATCTPLLRRSERTRKPNPKYM